MAVRGGSGRFADSSSLTSVETMPSPKTEVRPYLKLSRRRSSLRDRENSIHLSHEPSKVLFNPNWHETGRIYLPYNFRIGFCQLNFYQKFPNIFGGEN